ncbi:haloacid dehalogenase-like hydrolase domain-containing 5 isoform X4 [Hydra vulgaris]|uniref:Haloacid dehalogenase-like hydrolase domain-containing 5 isoform X4 n=1 Tax=Hydra vulgaris TaxID=6087 RepID=A0ABM4DEV8_HYDVU
MIASILKRCLVQRYCLIVIAPKRYFCMNNHIVYNDVISKLNLSKASSKEHKVGVVFDIDGVLVRGSKTIPCAKAAINKLNKFNVPLIYLTNGGCETEDQKARSLSHQLGIEPKPLSQLFSPPEAILLMGEPINWERSLQILLDLLLTSGQPKKLYSSKGYLPIVAINTDFLWMSEATNPRLGHGGFLLCLEALFLKYYGKPLQYTAVLGKPNIFTYRYTEGIMLNLVTRMFGDGATVKTIYGVGDNIDTDIYGANLYNNYLKALQGSDIVTDALHPTSNQGPRRMKSILVKTGVSNYTGNEPNDLNHLHRDTVYRPELVIPTHICEDVLHAVDTILNEEQIC